jgi:hypothetical protein
MSNTATINSSKTVIFHPGMGKTATSAIQSIGLRYTAPSESTYFCPHGVLGGAHNLFASNHPHFTQEKFNFHWDNFIRDLESYSGNVVISSEFFIFDKPDHISFMIESIKNAGFNVQAIFGIRSYTNYLISAFLQAVKVQWGIKPNEDIFSYSLRELGILRLPIRIDNWSRNIGDENIFLIDYDLNKINFVKMFFNAISLNFYDSDVNTTNIVNPSIKLAIAPMLQHFDRISNNPSQRQDFIAYLNKLDFSPNHEMNIKHKIQEEVVKNAYAHDIERLTVRYTWI